MVGARRKARTIALQALYEIDTAGHDVERTLTHLLDNADRNILRLAIFEILLDNKVPVKVVINEAVELAKTFGSDNSARFVNGVLGSISTLASR